MVIACYMHWLHTRWPAGTIEKLPEVGAAGLTNVPGVRVVGDLTGVPLLKFSADTGARAVQAVAKELGRSGVPAANAGPGRGGDAAPTTKHSVLDLAIIGGGVSGISAALEAKQAGLNFKVFEAVQPFATIINFPKAKPIYAYPTAMTPAGQMQFKADVKEALLEELEAQKKAAGIEVTPLRIERIERDGGLLGVVAAVPGGGVRSGAAGTAASTTVLARRVIVAIGRSGNYRKLNVPGENLDKVYNRLYDPKESAGQHALVVGGGDSALETAIALAVCGAHVTLSYRNKEFTRPKPGNIAKLQMLQRDPLANTGVEMPTSERVTTAMDAGLSGQHAPGSLKLMMASNVKEIRPDSVIINGATIKNDVVFVMIGREAPLDFFRRSGIAIRGEWTPKMWAGFIAFLLFCIFLFTWKSGGAVNQFFRQHELFPYNISAPVAAVYDRRVPEAIQTDGAHRAPLQDLVRITMRDPGFYYSLAYCTCVMLFGIERMRRRKTPYIKAQTLTLMAVQVGPLFLLPYIILPALGQAGWFDTGVGELIGENLFPHGEYWRAFGFILAWPLFIWNFFTDQPLWWWLIIGFIQTFVILPLIIRRWGKGAYCGWICSCGALAETLGDRHRTKMPHGPLWNRLNMTGQVILAIALLLFGLRIVSWAWPGGWADGLFHRLLEHYDHVVDIFLAGIVGVGMYFWFSGRVWCRFACPLAALMHLYARFSKFRIFPEKSKCISCNVCTSVCHQGIDIMNFANKGLPMEDPECVRCSACVQECPTGTLAFGRFGPEGAIVLDKLPASPVRMRELRGRPAPSTRSG